MTFLQKPYLEREFAEGFGALAIQYDRFRPSFPEELMDCLATLRPSEILDVGCGTGKVSVALAKRGLDVLGVEPDARMAEVAREHGVSVEVSGFEDWEDAGRRFDLIVTGDAWHWIDPERGNERAAELLKPGGTIARFWTYHELDVTVLEAFDPLYQEYAPAVRMGGYVPKDRDEPIDPLAGHEAFVSVDAATYLWGLEFTSAEWVGLVSTHSDHMRLEPAKRHALLTGLGQVIDDFGGTVRTKSTTIAQFAKHA
ncbi:class I SAM-dependent methyltransferase [Frankia sp. AgPm24]|uniref:class I SAM-dependent methyltransferase n=1 Tax=Frankia sp. AgPm24 TaxID=631128 RepID=UPI00200C0C32|nr:class I SAM-dependent methyltransferase [Frankia sp. AgPm24]MCK9921543.1 class I SAM-dependent methyltransferase [Frankia sp. AgPm24]